MSELLTIAEIRTRYASEWILLEDPETGPHLEVVGGRLLFHSKDRDEVYRQALKRRPRHSAVLYTGSLPGDVAVVL